MAQPGHQRVNNDDTPSTGGDSARTAILGPHDAAMLGLNVVRT